MKTLCKGKSKRVAFLAFLDFVFEKAYEVTFYHAFSLDPLEKRHFKGIFVAKAKGCQNRVFVNTSYFTRRVICMVSIGSFKNFTPVQITVHQYLEILNSLSYDKTEK